jgi:hypothetical protein
MGAEHEFTSPSLQSIRTEVFEQTRERAMRMLETGASQTAILTCLVTGAEVGAGPGAVASILVLDEEGLLRNGASPNLPRDYLNAIDRLKPDPKVGTCAAAAATGLTVVTPDFCADDKWAELRHLPLALGFVGAWSTPIFAEDGTVLGTFGTYYRESRPPTLEEIRWGEVPGGCGCENARHHVVRKHAGAWRIARWRDHSQNSSSLKHHCRGDPPGGNRISECARARCRIAWIDGSIAPRRQAAASFSQVRLI